MKIYRIVQAGRREFWISAEGEVKTEADFEEESEIGKDLFHLNSAMMQMRNYITTDDNVQGNFTDPSVWDSWKQYKVQDLYTKLMSDPKLTSEEQDSLTQEYYSTSVDAFIGNYIDQITFRGQTGVFSESEWRGANEIEADPSEQIITKWGWKRVSGSNIATYDFSASSLQSIVKGLVAGYQDLVSTSYDTLTFTIEVMSANSVYYNVPFPEMVEAVRQYSPQLLNPYRHKGNMSYVNYPAQGVENRL